MRRTTSCSTPVRPTRTGRPTALERAFASWSGSCRTLIRTTSTSRWTSTGRTSRSTGSRRSRPPTAPSSPDRLRSRRRSSPSRRSGSRCSTRRTAHRYPDRGRLHDRSFRSGQHRLHDVLPAHRRQGLAQLDVRAGQRRDGAGSGLAGAVTAERHDVVRAHGVAARLSSRGGAWGAPPPLLPSTVRTASGRRPRSRSAQRPRGFRACDDGSTGSATAAIPGATHPSRGSITRGLTCDSRCVRASGSGTS